MSKSLPKRCLFRCKITKKSFIIGYFDAKIITSSITIRLSSVFLFSNYTFHNNKISIQSISYKSTKSLRKRFWHLLNKLDSGLTVLSLICFYLYLASTFSHSTEQRPVYLSFPTASTRPCRAPRAAAECRGSPSSSPQLSTNGQPKTDNPKPKVAE